MPQTLPTSLTARCRWHGTAADFIELCAPSNIDRLLQRLAPASALQREDAQRRGETGSWANSLPRIAKVLQRARLQSAYVLLEYNPYQQGNARVDVIVAGQSPAGQDVYVVVEIKQWSACTRDPRDGRIRGTGAGYERAEGLQDPFEQARDYATFIRNYTQGMHDEASVAFHPVAYLHNATRASAQTLLSADWEQGRNVFTGGLESESEFAAHLRSWLSPEGEHEKAGRRLVEAGYEQAPALLDAASVILTDPARYPMSADQGQVHAAVLHSIEQALSPAAERSRAVVVVNGGPGTGKTWIAMHLLGANARARRQVSYAAHSTSLRSALTRRARQGLRMLDQPVSALITSPRTYWSQEQWAAPLDVLIVDEAHRVTEFTVRTGHANPRALQDDLRARNVTQMFELAKSAKVLVLLIDEDQSITPKDDCSVEQIKAEAARVGASFQEFHLTEQHRSGGSDAYEAWVDALLAGTPVPWQDEPDYTVRVADSPEELERLTLDPASQVSEGDSRLLAGFCWEWQPWPDGARSIDDVPHDIVLGDWRKRWNLRKGIDGYPADRSWAATPQGAAQVGSVFTAQGFEFRRCGVIIGPDFRWDPDRSAWVVDATQTKYPSLQSAARRNPAEATELVRNHYRVLLTRAMTASVIYSTDPATRAKLQELVSSARP